ncbi:Peptidoglycan-binding Lysin subgroup [Penicillium verrucosum]|uniref:Peptidoglycan-binding Lysin subgroup n=1 Tax=Penicillium verrucosum TaxID=60171 RepID=UPI00254555B5|nr:Peptidoglycan-binding Lysin subgroup [Penicillium verrucosum]KAJ5922500.1 Peptidoglycan-binding Lysin subgroup [Penicillium verrucosum]
MFFPSLILAAGSLSTLIQAIPHGANSHHSLHRRAAATYAVMGGNGDPSDGWPSLGQWSEYETLDINTSIKSVASETGVDPRFILAIIMQESKGCVRVQSTNNGVVNTGLMQSHAGEGSCNKDGSKTTPCPSSMIKQMIKDGTAGTTQGDGLKQCFESQSGGTSTKYFKAARTYNSGSIDSSGNLGQGGATHCYASDIANRVRGWAGDVTECIESTIGTLTSGVESVLGGDDDSSSSSSSSAAEQPTEPAEPAESIQTSSSTAVEQPAETAPSAPVSAAQPAETTSVAPVPIWTPSVNVHLATQTAATPSWTTRSTPAATTAPTVPSSSSGTAPLYPHASSSCQKYYTVTNGDFCSKLTETVGISFSNLRSLNPGLNEKCSDLWLGYQYCIQA